MNKKDILKVVRGNTFAALVQIKATTLDGREVENFDLASAANIAVKVRTPYRVVALSECTVVDETHLQVAWPADKQWCGIYSIEVTGKFDGKDWRSMQSDIIGIVETNQEANIPAECIISEDYYNLLVDLQLVTTPMIQSDWEEDDDTKTSYILNKPTIPTKVSQLSNDAGYLQYHQDISGKADVTDLASVAFSGSYEDLVSVPEFASVATSGSYSDLSNKPTIPAAQVQSDWDQSNSSAVDYIKNKPTIPTVPTNVSSFTNDAGYLTSHQDITGKEDKMSISAASGTTLTAAVNTYYRFDSAVGTLAITLPVPTDTTHVSTIIFCLTTGSTTAVTFTSTATIHYHAGYAIAASTMYEINALYNGSAWVIMSNEITPTV